MEDLSAFSARPRLAALLDHFVREDLSRLRIGHGAKNMAVVRHFALNLVRPRAENVQQVLRVPGGALAAALD